MRSELRYRDEGREESRVEGYEADGLAVSGEVCVPDLARVAAAAEVAERGYGPVAVRAVRMIRAAGRMAALDDMEALAVEEGRRIGCESLQLALDNQAYEEARLPGVTGSDGVRRTRLEDSGVCCCRCWGT